MSMAVESDSAGVRFPPPFVYLGALLSGLAVERFVTLRSFGIDWRLLVATGALLFVAGGAMMLAAAVLFRRLGTNVPPSQPTTLIATTGPYRWPCEVLFAKPSQRQPAIVGQLGLELDNAGLVKVDEQRRTSRPGVYAAGDMITLVQGAVLGAAAGCVAAMMLNQHLTAELAAQGA